MIIDDYLLIRVLVTVQALRSRSVTETNCTISQINTTQRYGYEWYYIVIQAAIIVHSGGIIIISRPARLAITLLLKAAT